MEKASEIWKEIKPKIGEMLTAVNNIETRAEKAQEEAYQKGLSDAWETARKLYNMPHEERMKCLGAIRLFSDKTPQEAIAKIAAYEEKKKQEEDAEINVGDELKGFDERYIVFQRWLNNMAMLFNRKTGKFGIWHLYNADGAIFEKTGEHFPEIAEILRKMQEGEG
jgi:hypothetical protein